MHVINPQEQVELTCLKDALVGTDEGLGLSFEQKKRLSIAVELAASPSILFLDEVRNVAGFRT
jgi:ABC-type multidrug transport system ATPase subunit